MGLTDGQKLQQLGVKIDKFEPIVIKKVYSKKVFDDNDGKILTTSQNGQNVWKWWFGLHPIQTKGLRVTGL